MGGNESCGSRFPWVSRKNGPPLNYTNATSMGRAQPSRGANPRRATIVRNQFLPTTISRSALLLSGSLAVRRPSRSGVSMPRRSTVAKATRRLSRVPRLHKHRPLSSLLGAQLSLAALTLSVVGVGALDGCSGGVSSDAGPAAAAPIEPIAECSAYAERMIACATRASAQGGAAMAAGRAVMEADLIASAKDEASREAARSRCANAINVLATSCR